MIQSLAKDSHVCDLAERIDEDTKKGRKLILSASRVDYTKGNEELLLAYERLLERRPEMHGKVVLMLACVAAASGMKIYEDTQRLIEETIGRINGRFSQIDWVPIRFSTRRIPMKRWCLVLPGRHLLDHPPKRWSQSGRQRICSDEERPRCVCLFCLNLPVPQWFSMVPFSPIPTPISRWTMPSTPRSTCLTQNNLERMARMSAAVETFTVSDWAAEQMNSLETPIDPMNWMKRTSSRFILVIVSIIASTLLGVSTLARQADSVSNPDAGSLCRCHG